MAASTQKKPAVKSGGRAKRTDAPKTVKRRRATTAKTTKTKPKTTTRTRKPRAASAPPVYQKRTSDASMLHAAFHGAGRLFGGVFSVLRRLFRAHGRRIALFTLLVLTLCDVVTFLPLQLDTPSDGILVNWLSTLFRGLFGYGYFATLVALPIALLMVWKWDEERPVAFPAFFVLSLPMLIGMMCHLLLPGMKITRDQGLWTRIRDLWETGQTLTSGGVLSGGVAELFRAFFSQAVTIILLLIALFKLPSILGLRRPSRQWEYVEEDEPAEAYRPAPVKQRRTPFDEDEPKDDAPSPEPWWRTFLDRLRRDGDAFDDEDDFSDAPDDFDWFAPPIDEDEDDEPDFMPPTPPPPEKPEKADLDKEETPKPKPKPRKPRPKKPDAPESATPAEAEAKKPRRKKEPDMKETVRKESEKVEQDISRKASRASTGGYQSPPIDLLAKNPNQDQREDRTELARNAKRLEDTLTSFDVSAVSTGEPVRGPSITRYEFKLDKGVKLSKIMNLADDIALSLGSAGVRIAPIQNKKSVVGIEVPNSQKTPVLLRDVVETRSFLGKSSATTFALGRDISGDVVTGCIEELPHVLIAGTTGSGKSVCTNSMIISLLYKSAPEQLRFIMIDPKMVELAPYNGIPHLLIPVVTDPRKAAGALQWAVGEMMRRYKLFSENGVKKLSEYQKLTVKNKELTPLASVVVVIDELADLMMVAAKEVEESIMRVAQMGRAAGMHLVIATQRPSADVITGLMKANIPSRIAFAVASAMESRIILDSAGAEKLVGNGDMLYAPLGGEKKRVQGCYVSPEEIENVVRFVKGEQETRYDDDVLATIDASVNAGQGKEPPPTPQPVQEQDELLPAAVEIVLETGQASVSMLQRRLKLGYSRAARLVDQMELRGYVGPFEGSRPRQLLITREQWQELRMGE